MAYLADLKSFRDALMSALATDMLAEKATVEAGGTIRVSYSAGGKSVSWTGSKKDALEAVKTAGELIRMEEIPAGSITGYGG